MPLCTHFLKCCGKSPLPEVDLKIDSMPFGTLSENSARLYEKRTRTCLGALVSGMVRVDKDSWFEAKVELDEPVMLEKKVMPGAQHVSGKTGR
jgi:hypothetical protein